MAVYEGARPRTIGLPRRAADRARGRRSAAGASAVRSGPASEPIGSDSILGSIVVAFMLAFFSLAQQVRVSATGLDIGRLSLERQRLEARERRRPLGPRPARS